MKRTVRLAAAAALLGSATMSGAQAATNGSFYATAPAPTISPMLGYYVWGNDSAPRGLSIGNMDGSLNPVPLWDISVDPSTNDLFIYNRTGINSQLLRVRADTGQVSVGQTSGQPVNSSQVDIWGGTATASRAGLGINTFAYQNSLNLLQQSGPTVSKRTAINFNGMYSMGTDLGALNNPHPDWYLSDAQTGRLPIIVSDTNNSDRVYIANGLQIQAGPLLHMGSTLGFYGATPVSKPNITGCRSDGTALQNLLQALQSQGLITNNTTP